MGWLNNFLNRRKGAKKRTKNKERLLLKRDESISIGDLQVTSKTQTLDEISEIATKLIKNENAKLYLNEHQKGKIRKMLGVE